MAQIQKKFIAANAVDGSKIRLLNAESLRARNFADSGDINILSVDVNDRIVFASVPQSPSDAVASNDLVRFSQLSSVTYTGGDMITVSSNVISVDLSASGGLSSTNPGNAAGQLQINVDNSSIEISTNALRVKAGGITNAMIASAAGISVNKLEALTVSSPVRSDASGFLTTGAIALGSEVSGTLPIANGGTGQVTASAAFDALSPMTTAGDIIIGGASGTGTRLAAGTDGFILTMVSGAPAWAADSSANKTMLSEQITLSGGDITAQFVDLAHPVLGASASVNSLSMSVAGGPQQVKTVDFSVSLTGGSGGVGRITFLGDLATAGAAELIAGDILLVQYEY